MADLSLRSDLIGSTLNRIESLVDEETEALRRRQPVDLANMNARKSQGLHELTKAMRAAGVRQPDAALMKRLEKLNAKLDVNRSVLRTHIAAVQEVSDIVAGVIRDADSDGTYSRPLGSPGAGE